MPIQFYHGNKKVTGSACSFWITPDKSVMSSMIKQDGWNDAKRLGSFVKNKKNPKGNIIVKLSQLEIVNMIDALSTSTAVKAVSGDREGFYHQTSKAVTNIFLEPYQGKGFSYRIIKQEKEDSTNKVSIVIGFNQAEVKLLREFLKFALNKTFEDGPISATSNPYSSATEETEASNLSMDSSVPEEDIW